MRAAIRFCLLSAGLAAAILPLLGPAGAADLPNWPASGLSPTPVTVDPTWDPWAGLYVGTGVSAWGGKGVKGGFGAEGYIGYDHIFDNGVILGVRASGGYGPGLWSSPRGFTQFTGTAFAGGTVALSWGGASGLSPA